MGSSARVISFDGSRSSSSLSCCSDDDSTTCSGSKIQSEPIHSDSNCAPKNNSGSLMRSRKRGQSSNLCSLASLTDTGESSTASLDQEERDSSSKKARHVENDHSDSDNEAWGQFVDVIPNEDSVSLFVDAATSSLLSNVDHNTRPFGRRRMSEHPYLPSYGVPKRKLVSPGIENETLNEGNAVVFSASSSRTLSENECFSLNEDACSLLESKMKRLDFRLRE